MRRLPLLLLLAAATTLGLLRPVADTLFGYYDGNIMVGKVAACVYNRTEPAPGDPWGPHYVYRCRGVFTLWPLRKMLYPCGKYYYAVGLGDRALVFYTGQVYVNGTVTINRWDLFQMHNVTAFGDDWTKSSALNWQCSLVCNATTCYIICNRLDPPVPQEISLFEWCYT